MNLLSESWRAEIALKARSYTPEWRFSTENPDAGSAMALIIGGMLRESEAALSRAPEKYHIQFLNLFEHLCAEPVETAKSYVRFVPVAGADEPVHVPKGTRLFADDPESGQRLIFETSHSIAAVQAQLSSVVATERDTDRIARLYDGAQEGQEGFRAFGLSAANEAEHVLLLGFDDAFEALDDVSALLTLAAGDTGQHEGMPQDLRVSLLEPEGERPFKMELQEGGIRLSLPGALPRKAQLGGRERYVLCIRQQAGGAFDGSLRGGALFLAGNDLPPDAVICGGAARPAGSFAPFLEPMEIYAECAIECGRAFARRGAQIEMDFDLGFHVLERRLPQAVEDPNYRVIMRSPAPQPKLEAMQVRADYVLLEYRGKRGWRRLLEDEYTALLFGGSAEGPVHISFRRPDDMAPEDGEPRLRLRLLRAENLYSMPSVQYCPVITGLRFSYRYEPGGLLADYACTRNNFEVEEVTAAVRAGKPFQPFYSRERARRSMYLGFDSSPAGMPLSLYFDLVNDEDITLAYTVEYLSARGFAPLQAVDGTGGLLYAGALLLPAPRDCARRMLFGRDCWWLRMTLTDDVPAEGALPIIRAVIPNMARVENLQSRRETFFLTDPDAPFKLSLAQQNLSSVEVFVNEEDGEDPEKENWVRWGRAMAFGEQGRVCDIDPAAGTVEFRKNVFVSYPLKQGGPAVRVDYRSFQGAAANLPAGSISQLEESIPLIASVFNPAPACGGRDGYGVESRAAAAAALLRTRSRAVTVRDYLDIIAGVSAGVRRIKVICGVTPQGERDDGVVTVSLLLENYNKGGYLFSSVRDAIRRRLEEAGGLLAVGKRLALCQPRIIRYSARVWLDCGPQEDPYELQRQVLSDIAAFLDPFAGGFEGRGWEIGDLPTRRQLLAYLKMCRPGLALTRLVLSAGSRGWEYPADEQLAAVLGSPFVVAADGEHTVYIGL